MSTSGYFSLFRIYVVTLSLSLLTLSGVASATYLINGHTPQQLKKARALLPISPDQTKVLANDYLVNSANTMKFNVESAQNAFDPTQGVRNQVLAHQFIATAEFLLDDYKGSIFHSKKALDLTQQFGLLDMEIDVLLHEASLLYALTNDKERVLPMISSAKRKYYLLSEEERKTDLTLYYSYHIALARIYSKIGEEDLANEVFSLLETYIKNNASNYQVIEYGLTYGEHLYNYEQYNQALKLFIKSHWKAIEFNYSEMLARTNYYIGRFYFKREIYSKAEQYFIESANFYAPYEKAPLFTVVLQQLADTYYVQEKYNLALVQYFNVLEYRMSRRNIKSIIELKLQLARTYIHLSNYLLGERYLMRAKDLLDFVTSPRLQLEIVIVQAYYNNSQHQYEETVKLLLPNYEKLIHYKENDLDTIYTLKGLRLLTDALIKTGDSKQALDVLQQHHLITSEKEQIKQQLIESSISLQVESYEQTIHFKSQVQDLEEAIYQRSQYRRVAIGLSLGCLFFILLFLQKTVSNNTNKKKIRLLSKEFYTHPRSHLKNIRMLNLNLSSSLLQSSNSVQQWQMGELIHEPLRDRLRFALIDFPYVRNTYFNEGYQAGLELEKELGQYITSKLHDSARIYHFSDGLLLYVENRSSSASSSPKALFENIQSWMDSFNSNSLDNTNIQVGFIDYPFLPRALTAIDDRDLIELLLFTTNLAKQIQIQQPKSQWVYLQAITYTPAASFPGENTRAECAQAIKQGMIKVSSSCDDEKIMKNLSYD